MFRIVLSFFFSAFRLDSLLLWKVASGGRLECEVERNEINIIEILHIIFDSNCFYGSARIKRANPRDFTKWWICLSAILAPFCPLSGSSSVKTAWCTECSVGRMSFGFSLRYQRHDYKITVFSFIERGEREVRNEWCSSKSCGVELKLLLNSSNYIFASRKKKEGAKSITASYTNFDSFPFFRV